MFFPKYYLHRMKKLFITGILFSVVCSSCLFYADPSENPPRTFMKSLAKKDGNWTLSEISLTGYTTDPLQVGATPAIDTVFNNTGTFHFDDYDGDIDGTGTFTLSDGSENSFTFKVPDFDESMMQSPEMSIFFNGYPVMICYGNDYKEADVYTFTGQVTEDTDYFPLVSGIPPLNYQFFEFSFEMKRN